MADSRDGLGTAREDEREPTHQPLPKSQREGIALCLSGGGFRAGAFHLGALRRLNELGLLGRVDVISSVSGGSIVSAHLATKVKPWPAPGDRIDDFDRLVAGPLREFISKNLRTVPIAKRLLPWNWPRSRRAVTFLAKAYERSLTSARFAEVGSDRPKFVFCATDMAFGVNWTFDSGSFHPLRRRVGDYQAGYLKAFPDWPLGRVVAASSCFPPVFNPMLLGLSPGEVARGAYEGDDWAELVRDIGLSDGGVYDNMGLEPVWKRAAVVLVSDGGGPFEAEKDSGLVRRLNRYASVAGRQGGALRKRWLISSFNESVLDGTYWGNSSVAAHYDKHAPGYSEDLVDRVISQVRTDLDAFSPAEQAVLENHGYLIADIAAVTHLDPGLIEPDAIVAKAPYEEWLDEQRVREALRDSHKRKLLGRW